MWYLRSLISFISIRKNNGYHIPTWEAALDMWYLYQMKSWMSVFPWCKVLNIRKSYISYTACNVVLDIMHPSGKPSGLSCACIGTGSYSIYICTWKALLVIIFPRRRQSCIFCTHIRCSPSYHEVPMLENSWMSCTHGEESAYQGHTWGKGQDMMYPNEKQSWISFPIYEAVLGIVVLAWVWVSCTLIGGSSGYHVPVLEAVLRIGIFLKVKKSCIVVRTLMYLYTSWILCSYIISSSEYAVPVWDDIMHSMCTHGKKSQVPCTCLGSTLGSYSPLEYSRVSRLEVLSIISLYRYLGVLSLRVQDTFLRWVLNIQEVITSMYTIALNSSCIRIRYLELCPMQILQKGISSR